jgi:hypothetical protein
MKKKLTNEELDALASELFRSTAVSRDEIEDIVGSPMLFRSIKRRIETDRQRHKPGFFERWAGLPILNWSRAVAAFAMAVIFLAGTVTVFVMIKSGGTSAPVAKGPVNTDQPPAKAALPVQVDEPVDVTTPQPGPETASFKKEPARVQKTVAKRQPARQFTAPRFEAEGDFYPVTYGGSAEEMSRGGQIVRTEIPRSSLIAMGVDMPIESANEKIKTDLLVGPDGVVRGVRLVK